MKSARILFLALPVLLSVLACATSSGPATIPAGTDQGNRSLGAATYTPFSGVVCDRDGGWCADAWGLSVALTKTYLGDAAEAKLMQIMRDNPGMSTTEFTLSNGVRCNTEKRKCLVKGTDNVDPATQKALFN